MRYIAILISVVMLFAGACKTDPETARESQTSNSNITDSVLIQNRVEHVFSNLKTKDLFELKLTGETILDGNITFTIRDINDSILFNEEFNSISLIGYYLPNDTTDEAKEEFIIKRINEFFIEENFVSTPIGVGYEYDEDDADFEVWTDVKSDSTAVGFSYSYAEISVKSIAYSKKDKKVVVYFSCC